MMLINQFFSGIDLSEKSKEILKDFKLHQLKNLDIYDSNKNCFLIYETIDLSIENFFLKNDIENLFNLPRLIFLTIS